MDPGTQPKAQPIRLMALDCDRLFDKCSNRFGETENYSHLVEISKSIEECYGRFDGWATFMGVFAGPQTCLDYRVRDRPELQDMFIRFLEVLRRNLFLVSTNELPRGLQMSLTEAKPVDSAGDSPMIKPLLQTFYTAFTTIEESITRLNKLGVSIRSSTRSIPVVRARQFIAKNPGMVPLSEFEEKAYTMLFLLYPNAPESLRQQLVDALTDRYARLQYEFHRNKHTKFPMEPISKVIESGTDYNRSQKSALPEPVTTTSKPSHDETTPARADREIKIDFPASSINSKYLPLNVENSTTQSKATKTLTVRETSLREPTRPKFGEKKYTQCQWCFQMIEKACVRTAENGNTRWTTEGRRHYMRDLLPYVCIAEGCCESRPTFSSSKEWYGHMVSKHSEYWAQDIHREPVWRCSVEHENGSIYQFPTCEELHAHNSLHHGELRLTTTLKIYRRPASTCPLCFFTVEENDSTSSKSPVITPSSPHKRRVGSPQRSHKRVKLMPDPIGDERKATTWAMGEHIAEHLYHLMLVSLQLMATMDYPNSMDGDNASISAPTGSDLSDTDGNQCRRDLSDLPTELQGRIAWSEASAERKRIQHSLTLQAASAQGHKEVMQMLLEEGADVNALNARNALDSPDSYEIGWIAAIPTERTAAEAMLDGEHAAPTGLTRHQTDAKAYTIAWIAALPLERAAAEAMLDEEHAAPTGFIRHQTDANVYMWGRVGEHNIVIASSGVYGNTAATTALSLLAALPSIRVGLLVGIGGGIARPDEDHDIRLGDVVVSQPYGTTGGVCQYDFTKAKYGDKERKDFLRPPPTVLLNALASIQADHERKDSRVSYFLQEMLEKNPKMALLSKQNSGYAHQGFDNDRLFKASCDHVPGPDCRGCDPAEEVQRHPRDTTDPDIHYGTIASGNILVKDAATRDRIVADLGEDCICFEIEAAGLMNHFPCLVIRGICDYADSHKNGRWQRYASATAAAYAKELLAYVPAAEVQRTKTALEVLQLVEQQIDGVQQATGTIEAATDSIRSDLRADKIKRWLCPPDPSTNANHARMLRYEGTGAWLLENPVFLSWYSGSRRHLWLYGLMGWGKTVLSATVLDQLAKGNDRLIVSFFFDFNDPTKQTLDGMLRSLAFQLYQSGASSAIHLDALMQAHQSGSEQPVTKGLSDTVSKMLEVQRRVFIVLDALDESKNRGDTLRWIKHVISRPELVHVKLLCTSRPESEFLRDIPRLIGEQSCLPLDKQAVNADIRSWVTAQLSQRRDFKEKHWSQDIFEGIRRKVSEGADGMFIWAICQLDSLARCRNEADIEKALASLPLNLAETSRRMIASIPTKLKNDAERLLQFLVHSKRPLKLAEANEVIATQIENESRGFDIKRRLFCETDVLGFCPGLVTVVHATDKELHLAHYSIKEYLLGENQFKITTASISITKTCLTYLTDINGSNSEIKRDFPMARRAAEVWTDYAVLAQTSEDIVRVIVRFLEEEVTFQRWTRLYQVDRSWAADPGPPRGSRLYYACFVGLVAPARTLIGKGADVNTQGGEYGNALQAASLEGHQETVRLLLDKGADVHAQGGKYGNALQAASLEGHQEIVRLLLDTGADVHAQGGDYGNALQAASSKGHQEIVRLLLDKGANVHAQGGEYGNALQAASSKGHQEIVRLLLDKGADVRAQVSDRSECTITGVS